MRLYGGLIRSAGWLYMETGLLAKFSKRLLLALFLACTTGFSLYARFSPYALNIPAESFLPATSCANAVFSHDGSLPVSLVLSLVSSDSVICSGDTAKLDAMTTGAIAYAWSPAIGLSATTGASVTASPLATTTYTVTASYAGGSTASASITLGVTNPPALSITASHATCNTQNGSASVIAAGNPGPFTYDWNTVAPQFTQTAVNLSPGSYTCIVTDPYGCSSSATATISSPPVGLASITSFSQPACSGQQNGTATVTVYGGSGPYNYHWNTVPVQTNAQALSLPSGSWTVTITDANACTLSAVVILTDPPVIQLSASSADSYCSNPTGMGSVLASGGTGAYTYQWNTVPVQTNAIAAGLTAGTYTCMVSDSNACTASVSITVGFLNPPYPFAGLVLPVDCHGNSTGSASVMVTGGAPPYNYSWNSLPVQSVSTATGLAAGTYTITVTDAAGCTGTSLVSITEPPVLAALTGSTTTACNINNGKAFVLVSGGTPPYNYGWNTNPAQFTDTANGLATGTYFCQVTDSLGCALFLQIPVTGMTAGTPFIDFRQDARCNGSYDGMATVSMSGGTPPFQYTWNTSPVQTTATVTGLPAGNYLVTVMDAAGCSGTVAVVVSEPPVLTATTGSTNNYCGVVTALATMNASGGTPPYQYAWNTVPVQTTSLATGLPNGSYSCTVTDLNGCTLSHAFTISAVGSGSISINMVIPSCSGSHNGSVSAVVTGGDPPFSFLWNTSPVQTTAAATQLPAGTYTVLVTDGNGCTSSAIATLADPPILMVHAASVPESCSQHDGSASVTVQGGTLPYAWLWNTMPVQLLETATGLSAGSYQCLVTDARQCTTNISVNVTGTIQPRADFSWYPEVVPVQHPECSFLDQSLHAVKWIWNFHDAFNTMISNERNPVHHFADTGTYCVKLVVESNGGCQDSVEHCLDVRKTYNVFVPSAFTPNADGLNDGFIPSLDGAGSRGFLFEIYDRWGSLVFRSTSPAQAWNGSQPGGNRPAPDGIYLWKLQVMEEDTGDNHRYKGQVMMIQGNRH